MKIITRVAQWLFVACLPVMILTGSIAWAVNSGWLYTAGFEKYDVADSLVENGLPVTRADLKQVASGFIRYFNSGEEYIHLTIPVRGQAVELFNQDEIIHFKDVKGLFRLDYGVLLVTFLYCALFAAVAIFRRKYRLLARDMAIGGGITLGIIALLGVGIAFDFDNLFYEFHLISFSNQFWSAEGNMLLLFPGGFWYDMAVYVILFAAGLALVLGGVGGVYLWRARRKDKRARGNPSAVKPA
jgi:integral membrane protein (TIGR01906 family)